VLTLALSANTSDYLLDKEKDNTKCKISPKLIQTLPINIHYPVHANE